MIMASFLFMNRMTELQIKSMKVVTKAGQLACLSPEEESILERANGKIMLFHLYGALSFSSAKASIPC